MTRLKIFTLCLMSIFTYINSTNAQVGSVSGGPIPPGTIIIDNSGNSRPQNPIVELELNRDCEGTLYISVFVANLLPNGSGGYMFPPETHEPYLYFNINGVEGSTSLTSFSYYGVHIASGTPIFRKEIPVIIDFFSNCLGADQNPFINYNMRLTDSNGNDYPFYYNDAENQIFPCDVFCASCDNPVLESCMLEEYVAGWEGGFIVRCNNQCEEDRSGGGPDGSANPAEGRGANNDTKEETIHTMTIAPNPFTEVLEVVYSSTKNTTGALNFYNVQGELIFSRTLDTTTGANKVIISTDQWTPGMYYGQINTDDQTKSFKVIKAN